MTFETNDLSIDATIQRIHERLREYRELILGLEKQPKPLFAGQVTDKPLDFKNSQ